MPPPPLLAPIIQKSILLFNLWYICDNGFSGIFLCIYMFVYILFFVKIETIQIDIYNFTMITAQKGLINQICTHEALYGLLAKQYIDIFICLWSLLSY